MDPASLKTEFREDEVTHCANDACCSHGTCAPLKIALQGRDLCRQWFFLRWQPSTFLIPSDVTRELRTWLRGYEYRYCASLSRVGVCEIVVKIDHGVFEGPLSEFCRGFRLEVSLTRPGVWCLACCMDAYSGDVPFWVSCMTDRQEGRFFFGDKELIVHFVDDVKAVTSATRF